LIERVASGTYWSSRRKSIYTGQLYPIDLTPSVLRSSGILAQEKMDTFSLFKLHGSINWFYSGRSQFYGENLYFVPCQKGVDGSFDALMGSDPESPDWEHVGDKIALIIPPILDKQVFFQHESLRSMWFQAGQAIRDATKKSKASWILGMIVHIIWPWPDVILGRLMTPWQSLLKERT
jgi:hypothetical protein